MPIDDQTLEMAEHHLTISGVVPRVYARLIIDRLKVLENENYWLKWELTELAKLYADEPALRMLKQG